MLFLPHVKGVVEDGQDGARLGEFGDDGAQDVDAQLGHLGVDFRHAHRPQSVANAGECARRT